MCSDCDRGHEALILPCQERRISCSDTPNANLSIRRLRLGRRQGPRYERISTWKRIPHSVCASQKWEGPMRVGTCADNEWSPMDESNELHVLWHCHCGPLRRQQRPTQIDKARLVHSNIESGAAAPHARAICIFQAQEPRQRLFVLKIMILMYMYLCASFKSF